MENLKNDLKLGWNQLLINNDCNIFFKGDKIEINKENNFFEFDKINKIEILNVREKDNKKIGNSFHIYKITDYNDYIKYYKDKNIYEFNNCSLDKKLCEFKITYLNPDVKKVNDISNFYDYKKTNYNGLFISEKNVLISTENILLKSQEVLVIMLKKD